MATAHSPRSGITVKVTKYADRPFLTMYYDCPESGRRVPRTTKQTTEKGARKVAAQWEAELNEGRYSPVAGCSWEVFRDRFMQDHLAGLAEATYAAYATALNAFETICRPKRPADVTTERLAHFQRELRRQRKSASTISCYLRHIKAALNWAVTNKMLAASRLPTFDMPKRVKGTSRAKGRAITTEEFERMMTKVADGLAAPLRSKRDKPTDKPKRKFTFAPEVLAERRRKAAAAAPSWQRLLRGLWLSGLRLGESLDLSWDEPDHIRVDLSGRRPMLVILAECEKGRQDRLLPITPDFAAFLEETPEADRTGPVFRPVSLDGEVVTAHNAGKRISRMGKLAGVKVSDRQGKVKFASAHDLRRAFGFRWSTRVMPAVLKELMRHEDISTTMEYYVGQNAEGVADAIWAAAERINTSVNTPTPAGGM